MENHSIQVCFRYRRSYLYQRNEVFHERFYLKGWDWIHYELNRGDSMYSDLTLEKIVEEYGQMVSAVARRMVQDEFLAQDIAQEIWIEVMHSLGSFRGESKFSTWLYTIAYRTALKYSLNEKKYSITFLRQYFQREDIFTLMEDDLDEKIWVKEMCDKCLTGVLHCLTNDARLAYILRDIVQLEYNEIAQIMDKDSATVRKIISRSRSKLNNFLHDECILYNPKGNCNCRMKKKVLQINLPSEYQKIRDCSQKIYLYLESEKILSGKNFWKNIF